MGSEMITIAIPEWFVWLMIAGFVVQIILNIFTIRLKRRLHEQNLKLMDNLMRLARIRGQ